MHGRAVFFGILGGFSKTEAEFDFPSSLPAQQLTLSHRSSPHVRFRELEEGELPTYLASEGLA